MSYSENYTITPGRTWRDTGLILTDIWCQCSSLAWYRQLLARSAHGQIVGFGLGVVLHRLYHFSMTKPITTTTLMMLYEDGTFRLEDPIRVTSTP